jgi:chemotaxis protein CheD
VLQALGLGSCIGVLMYDRQTHTGGLAHVMLPDSCVARDGKVVLGKYADTAIPELLRLLAAKGIQRQRLTVKIAGGAEMFAFSGSDGPKLAVGARNASAVQEQLSREGLRISALDTGGNHGRTMEVNLDTLVCTLKVIGKPLREL